LSDPDRRAVTVLAAVFGLLLAVFAALTAAILSS
jgi:hypothetical protein